jgi:hypothetical protein
MAMKTGVGDGLWVTAIVYAFALLSLLGTSDSVAAQPDPAFSFATPAEEPVVVPLEGQNGKRVGQLNAVLQNDSSYDKSLVVEFVSSTDGSVSSLVSEPEYSADQVTLFTEGPTKPKVTPFGTVPLSLKFGIAKETELTSIDGVLVVKSDGSESVRPAILRVTLNIAEASFSWSDVSFQPDKANLVVSRWFPFGIYGDRYQGGQASIWFNSTEDSLTDQIKDEPPRDRLSSETGGTLKLSLSDADKQGATTEATIKATDITATGNYEGDLTLDPDAESPQAIPVTVRVQDLWMWPLAVLLLGVAAGYGLSKWYDRYRARELLRSALAGARDDYNAARGQIPAGCQYTLGEAFPSDPPSWGHKLGIPQLQARISNCDQLNVEAERLYCEIGKARSQEELDEVSKKVTDLVQRVAAWPDVCNAAQELLDALDKLEELDGLADPEDLALYRADKELLPNNPTPITNASNASSLLTRLADQTGATKAFIQEVWPLRARVRSLFEALEPYADDMDNEDRNKLHSNAPSSLDATFVYRAESPEGVEETVGILVDAQRDLLELGSEYRDAPIRIRRDVLDEQRLRVTVDGKHFRVLDPNSARPWVGVRAAFIDVPDRLYRAAGAEDRSSEQIIASLRKHDLFVSVVTALLAAAAYLLTIYPDQGFGSPGQYVAAFISGATGQVVIDSTIAPWFRSYKAPTGEAPTTT